MRKTIHAAIAVAALALSFGTITAPAQARSGVEIQIGPNGFSIEIDKHRHRRHNHHDDYYPRHQPAPYIDVVVYEQVGGWEDEWAYDRWGNAYRTGRQVWTTRSVARNVRAFYERGSYWYYDSYGRKMRYN